MCSCLYLSMCGCASVCEPECDGVNMCLCVIKQSGPREMARTVAGHVGGLRWGQARVIVFLGGFGSGSGDNVTGLPFSLLLLSGHSQSLKQHLPHTMSTASSKSLLLSTHPQRPWGDQQKHRLAWANDLLKATSKWGIKPGLSVLSAVSVCT